LPVVVVSIEPLLDRDYVEALDARVNSQGAYIDFQMHEARRAIPFLARFFDATGARVLEVGSGRGGKGIAYACHGMNVTSLDVDVPALRLGSAAARERHADLQFLAGDGAHMPLRADSFDAVLLDSVIEHVRDPFAVLQECRRVLKQDGIVFVVFPPFYGPMSGHISDFIMIPWFHLLPHDLVKRKLLTIQQEKGILSPRDTYEVYATLNGLTVSGFNRFARRAGFGFTYLRVRPFLTHAGARLAAGLISALRRGPRLPRVWATLARARRDFSVREALLFVFFSAIAPLVFIPIAREIAAGGLKAVLQKRQ
jgi:SAM-dependent methyltransferase